MRSRWIRIGALGVSSVVVLATAASPAHANLLSNGSFEIGLLPTPDGTTFTAGSTAIAGWVVGGHGIDYYAAYWQASNGRRSIDLDSGTILGAGPYDGSIAQTFATAVGQSYAVTFDMAGNPDGGPALKGLLVSAATASATRTFLNNGQTHAAMGYQPRTFDFVANATSTTLTFASLSGTGYGPVIDNVNVTAVPEPLTATVAVALWACAGRRRHPRAQR